MVDNSRRNLIIGSTVAAVASNLPGCSIFEWCRSPKLISEDYEMTCAGQYYPVFDTHGHFFNASDLQAGGYLSEPVINDLVRWLPNYPALQKFVNYLGDLVQLIGGTIAHSAQSEFNHLVALKAKSEKFESHDLLQQEYILDRDRASEKFYDGLSKEQQNRLDKLFVAAQEEESSKRLSKGLAAIQIERFNKKTIANALDNGEIHTEGLVQLGSKAKSIFQFIGRMLVWRFSNLDSYRRSYSKKGDASVVRVLDITVDFDHWLGRGYPVSSMNDQIKLHELMNEITGGYNVPILGVNPLKAHIHGQKYLDDIEKTLSRGIFKGIKLYPTLGFSPYGDMVDNISEYLWLPHHKKIPTSKELTAAFNEIYRICLDKKAVVMAHSKDSKGISSTASKLAGAKYWKKVLKNHPDLQVNLGHLGDISANNLKFIEKPWTLQFIEILAKYENVYGDFGYWFELHEFHYLKKFVELMKAHGGSYIFDKIMYGSDWYMINFESNWKNYLSATHRSFNSATSSSLITQEQMDKIFFKNATKLFGGVPDDCIVYNPHSLSLYSDAINLKIFKSPL